MMDFFVRVELEDKFSFHVVSFSGKEFCKCRDMIYAQAICEMLNYDTAKTKRDYAFVLVAGGYLHMDFLKASVLKRTCKDFLVEKYRQMKMRLDNEESS